MQRLGVVALVALASACALDRAGGLAAADDAISPPITAPGGGPGVGGDGALGGGAGGDGAGGDAVVTSGGGMSAEGGGATTGGGGTGGSGPVCGDGVAEGAEECDDGNTTLGDGCEACLVVCPPDWTELSNGHCYRLFTDSLTWAAAEADCASFGAGFHLATLTTLTEVEEVAALTNSDDQWIGANDLASEGSFLWVTGEPFTWAPYTAPWEPDNPDNSGDDEHCVELKGTDAQINDDDCDATNERVCEYTPP